jgi:hypothetical protein
MRAIDRLTRAVERGVLSATGDARFVMQNYKTSTTSRRTCHAIAPREGLRFFHMVRPEAALFDLCDLFLLALG